MFGLMLTATVAAMSFYFFWRFWSAFRGKGWRVYAIVGVVLAALAGARVWGRVLDVAGWHGSAEVGRLIMLIWMVLLAWFLTAGVAMQIWTVLASLAARFWKPAGAVRLAPRVQFFAAWAVVALFTAAGLWEACDVRVEHVVVEVDRMPPGSDRIRIAQISDLHVGSVFCRQRLKAAVALLADLKPDIIVSTGDLVDGELHEIDHMAEDLFAVDAPLGKYAVLGNHEFYSGERNSLIFHQHAGFKVLRQQSVEPLEGLRIVGVDDPAAFRFTDGRFVDETAVLRGGRRDDVVVLLKHRPDVTRAAVGLFDIQLSGHTHGGQVLPFNWLIRIRHAFAPGGNILGDGSMLYVSRGTGTWGPPFRVFARPEVTLIEVRPAAR
ncbi:MAG: metallophosphoesterase [Planctomycetes bacterium]|nr:metallophosphoesterase [Planctomycetota bacterium]